MIKELKRIKVKMIYMCMFSALLLSSCVESVGSPKSSDSFPEIQTEKIRPHKKIVSEKLLRADGHWNIVEKSQSYDPAKAHLKARQNVDTNRRKIDNKLSAHFKPDAKSGQDGNLRVLRLEPSKGGGNRDDVFDDIMVADNIPDDSNKINDISENVIIPPSLPKRRMSSKVTKNSEKSIIPQKKPHSDKAIDSKSINNAPVPSTKPRKFSKTKKSASSSIVSKLSASINSGNVRVIMEVSHATKYKVAIDSLRKVLRIKMDNTSWNISTHGNISGSSLLGTYIVRKQKDGSSLFEVRLKNNAKIVKTMVLRPNLEKGYRVVVDLKEL